MAMEEKAEELHKHVLFFFFFFPPFLTPTRGAISTANALEGLVDPFRLFLGTGSDVYLLTVSPIDPLLDGFDAMDVVSLEIDQILATSRTGALSQQALHLLHRASPQKLAPAPPDEPKWAQEWSKWIRLVPGT